MELKDIFKQLPSHWEIWSVEEAQGWTNDGRDVDKPIFIRKDCLATIYFNDSPGAECVYSITFDFHSDGECFPTLEEAISYADKYVETYPLEYHTCQSCQVKASWYYTPAPESFLNDYFYCADHVPRGCSCNIDTKGGMTTETLEHVNGELKPLPCCEYTFNEYGFPKEQ